MPRPRFHKLPADQQQAILRAAREEFSTHGFNAASLNGIIDEAGISKGSMYYYFDGKEDLYAHVTRVELKRVFDGMGPFPVPAAREPDAFWATLTEYYLRIMEALTSSPQAAALAREWITASASPALAHAQTEMQAALMPWFEQALAAGQRTRAIRRDVPPDLLVALVFGMGQAMDTWLLSRELDKKTLRKLARLVIGMMRKALSPQ